MRSSRATRLAAIFLFFASASLSCVAEGRSASLCKAGESVFFSCAVRAKTVSLCARKAADKIETLVYRYGVPGRIEKEFRAGHDNRNRFFGYVSPANPQASIGQVWFAQGQFRYLLTACTGGDCSQPAGLTVLRGTSIRLNDACSLAPRNDTAWFSPDLVEFGADLDTSRSKTDLLKLEEADNPIEKIYRPGRLY
jgi:hypothetical protein